MKTILTTILFCFLLAGVCLAQTPIGAPPPLLIRDDEVLNINSRLIMVPVSVTDGNGNPVKGLGIESFSVSENNNPQVISEVSAAEKIPLEIALLFDVSGSTDPMFRFEQETAAHFLQSIMRPGDHASIFTIGEKPIMVQGRGDVAQSIETIRNIQRQKQYTAFFDSVSAAAKYLDQNAPVKSRKVVIAITDGEDTNSEIIRDGFEEVYREADRRINTLNSKDRRELFVVKRNEIKDSARKATLKHLQDSDSVFYAINPAGSSLKINSVSRFGQENLNTFAGSTGGTAFVPSFYPVDLKSDFENGANEERNLDALDTIFKTLASELQSQYLVQYYSDGDYPVNKYINVGVKLNLNLPQGTSIRSRSGYFVK